MKTLLKYLNEQPQLFAPTPVKNEKTELLYPIANVAEFINVFQLVIFIPGVDENNIRINLINETLEIYAYYFYTDVKVQYYRTWPLPAGGDWRNIKIVYQEEFLMIFVPKKLIGNFNNQDNSNVYSQSCDLAHHNCK